MRHSDKRVVTVNPTNKCNLRCDYCMASSDAEQGKPISIDLDFAKTGIADALSGYPTRIIAQGLRFFSPGEPTQEMNVVRECVNFARSIDPYLAVELQTNGLFDSPSDTEFIRDNINKVWFSLDGPPYINDVNRPDEDGKGRTREIERNMLIVGERAKIGVRPTVVEKTLDHQDMLVEYYHDLGVKEVALNPVIRPIIRGEEGNISVTHDSIMHFARGFLKAYKKARELGMRINSSLTFNFDEPTHVACRSCLPMPQLNPDGSVSSCDMALYHDTKRELEPFIYGYWDEETGKINYDSDKIRDLRARRLGSLPKCDCCEIKEYCAGGCAGRVAYQTGSIYDVIPDYCVAIKWLGKKMELGQLVGNLTHP